MIFKLSPTPLPLQSTTTNPAASANTPATAPPTTAAIGNSESQFAPVNPVSHTHSELLAERGWETMWAGDDGQGVGAVAAGGQKELAGQSKHGCGPWLSL